MTATAPEGRPSVSATSETVDVVDNGQAPFPQQLEPKLLARRLDCLRGAVDPTGFKGYIFPLLFLRRIPDHWKWSTGSAVVRPTVARRDRAVERSSETRLCSAGSARKGVRLPALPVVEDATVQVSTAARPGTAPDRLRAIVDGARMWLPKGRTLPLADWRPRHRWLVALLWAHAVALPAFGIWRGYALSHSVLEGGLVGIFAAAATVAPVAHRWRAALAAIGLVTCSAVLVHFSGGTIEAHFHFFVVIILLTLYEDWIPFLIAFGYVVVHHGLAGTFAPETVYNHTDAVANPWKWALVHGAFVSAAGAGAIVAWRLNEDTRSRAGEAIARAVESEQANEVKDRFLATTSHELRTPLTSIAGFAATLNGRWDELEEDAKRRSIEIIESQSGRLSELIEELLLLSTVDRGQLRIKREPVRVRAVVERVVAGLGPGPEIVVDVPIDVVAVLDERYLARVVENYVGNARKYGAPPIRVSATRGQRWVEIAVTDGGNGVDDDFVPHLFEPFRRAVDETRVHGSGLGLSIVRGLVEAQGGDAWYERNRPRGACFKARFPQPADASG